MGEMEPIREINILVSDLEKSIKFYTGPLGMNVVSTENADRPGGYKRVRTTQEYSLCYVDSISR